MKQQDEGGGGENSYVPFFMLTDITTLSKTPVLSNASSSTFSSTTVVKRNADVAEASMSISSGVKLDFNLEQIARIDFF
jgi:hypothetical protein